MRIYRPQSMLVTGGAGFIGANFIRHVLQHEPAITIVNLDKLTYAGHLENVADLPHPDRYHFIHGDIVNKELAHDILLRYNIDTIVHFAAESHVDRSIDSPNAFVYTNVMGTFTLLEAAREAWADKKPHECRFHHISTDEVFGSLEPHDPAFNENTRYSPRSPYSASKAASDHFVQAYYHTYGLPITLSNCSNNYGPYQHAEKFIPTVINNALQGKPIPIYGNGQNRRDWIYVEDHCNAIMKVIKQAELGSSYTIGGENEWENLALATFICQELDKLHPKSTSYTNQIQFVKDRAGHDFRYAIDNTKIRTDLNWAPQENMASGLQKTIRYYYDKLKALASA